MLGIFGRLEVIEEVRKDSGGQKLQWRLKGILKERVDFVYRVFLENIFLQGIDSQLLVFQVGFILVLWLFLLVIWLRIRRVCRLGRFVWEQRSTLLVILKFLRILRWQNREGCVKELFIFSIIIFVGIRAEVLSFEVQFGGEGVWGFILVWFVFQCDFSMV